MFHIRKGIVTRGVVIVASRITTDRTAWMILVTIDQTQANNQM
jgi:hypothetical protein